MTNPILPTAARHTARGQAPNTQAAPQPIANTAQGLAQELASRSATALFLPVIQLITQNYLPHPALLTMLHDHLPIQSNPSAQLTSARTLDEFLACQHGLEEMLGRNQSGKTALLPVDRATYGNVPTQLIKYFVHAIHRNQQPLHMLPIQQQEKIIEFSSFLVDFTQSHKAPKQYVKELTPSEALTFLHCLTWRFDVRPISQTISDIRHELAVHFIKDVFSNMALVPVDLLDNQRFVEQAVILYSQLAYNMASARLQNEPRIQKLFLYRTGHISLKQPSAPEDKDCPLMAMAAAIWDEEELTNISDRLRNDRDFVMTTASEEPFVLTVCAEEFTNDRDFMLEAVSQYGMALEHASDELLDDPDIVLAAVKQDGHLLQFASERLKAHPAIILAAVNQNPSAIHYARLAPESEHA